VVHALTKFRQYKLTAVWGGAFGCITLLIGIGYLLRQLNVVFNPVPWASVQIISSFLSFSIAANVLVQFLGTDNRTSLFLGSTFGLIGFIQLAGIIELHYELPMKAMSLHAYHPLFSWMIGQTLLAVFLLLAFPIEKWLPWPRQRKKVVFAVMTVVAAAAYLTATTFFVLLPRLAINPGGILPRPSDLIPASIFLAATFVLYRNSYRNLSTFDSMLVWVAGMNAICHLVASESAQLLDAPAMTAQLLNAGSYAVLTGATLADNVRLFGEVRDRANSDSLTGLANYRQLVDVIQTELERSGRTNRAFSILLMDLDGLKEINDTHGHLTGSRAICRVANVLRLHSRSLDTAARYGGDEFALVLPETNENAAQQVATRIRKYLASEQETPRLSISIGVATYPESGASVQLLLDAADRELYGAKMLSRRSRGSRKLPLGI
jgi:diguanylate cyclase (GGDEF)-like protein